MIEKVNPAHPDKIADRIAGAIVDLAYKADDNPKIAVEILIGHGTCNAIIETSADIDRAEIGRAIHRIAGYVMHNIRIVPQNAHLAENQREEIRCGDNGIFTGMPVTQEERVLSDFVRDVFVKFPYDGKYILNEEERLIIACQSNMQDKQWYAVVLEHPEIMSGINKRFNPLGYWTGGLNVDTGATNRKLGSDMGHAVTGGGLHGKDLSKADVSVNIYAHLKAQATHEPVFLSCAIGDKKIDGRPYSEIVEIARQYITDIGGFEKFAEWGLI